MIIETHQITVSGLTVDVVRKDIKNLHLAVYPPAGRIRVAAPLRVSDEAVRLAVISRWAWIKQQRSKFTTQARQSEREYVSGESHYFQGSRYRLNVIYQTGAPRVSVRNKSSLDLYVRENSDQAQREKVLLTWYRQQLKALLPPLIAHWEAVIGVKVADWQVKKMKTKWGTCNIAAGRIWLNLELAKKSTQCLEYIIVHEMAHLLERHHNDRFIALLETHYPSWREARAELNELPLAAEVWKA
ncbi:MAG: SprT family zinc-dependent metalloprotease [Gallionella sp.]|nr:SprT family zinc-dependent metalloprotease [Gallionella sp.]